MTRTEELLALAEKATSGPWKWVGDTLESESLDADYATVLAVEQLPRYAYPELQSGELVIENDADRDFIAACDPETIKQLVELCRLQHGALKMYAERGYCDPYPSIAAFNKFEGGE